LDKAPDFGGWSFMGLRAATEYELRERQKEIIYETKSLL